MSGETEAIGVSNLTFDLARPSEGEAADAARIQREIDATMRQVIATASYDPTRRDPMPTVRVAGAGRVSEGVPLAPVPLARGPGRNGWVESQPLASPPGQDIIERMANAALPPAPKPPTPAMATDAASADASEEPKAEEKN